MIIKWQSGTRRLPAQSDFQLVSPPNLQPAVQTKSIQVAWRQCKGRCLHCHCLRLHTTQQTRAVQIDFLIDYFYLFTIRLLASRPHHMVSSWQLHCPVCVLMCRDVSPAAARAGPWPRVMQIPGQGDTHTFTCGWRANWELQSKVFVVIGKMVFLRCAVFCLHTRNISI